jgi:hypothetical protein
VEDAIAAEVASHSHYTNGLPSQPARNDNLAPCHWTALVDWNTCYHYMEAESSEPRELLRRMRIAVEEHYTRRFRPHQCLLGVAAVAPTIHPFGYIVSPWSTN